MASINVRIDEDVKRDAEVLFEELGLSLSGAVNLFFRQALRERAIPFTIRAKAPEEKYNEYFTPQTVKGILRSVQQVERGEMITFSIAELEAMENGEIPRRVKDFLEASRKVEI